MTNENHSFTNSKNLLKSLSSLSRCQSGGEFNWASLSLWVVVVFVVFGDSFLSLVMESLSKLYPVYLLVYFFVQLKYCPVEDPKLSMQVYASGYDVNLRKGVWKET